MYCTCTITKIYVTCTVQNGAHTLTDKRAAHDNGHHLQSDTHTIQYKRKWSPARGEKSWF